MSASTNYGQPDDVSTVRVLIVDDEPHALDVMSLALGMAGFDVLTAADGREGLRQTLQHAPHVVLTDIHMPGMDGDELAREIVDRLGAAAPPIVGFSADRDVVDRLKDHHVFWTMVWKPVSPSRLIALVRSCLPSGGETVL